MCVCVYMCLCVSVYIYIFIAYLIKCYLLKQNQEFFHNRFVIVADISYATLFECIYYDYLL